MPDKFIISVVPLIRISLMRDQFFYYLGNEKLSPGTLVSIPFSGRKIEGIVIDSAADFERTGGMELKRIGNVIEKDFLTAEQMELARFISEYYISPLGIVMKNFVPKIMKRSLKEKKKAASQISKLGIELTKEQHSAVSEISDRKKGHAAYLLFGSSGSGKTEVYIHSILELKKQYKDGQFLILLPEKTLTPQALERYGAYFDSDEIVVLSSNISKGKFYDNWKRIRSGEAKIIIGTRMAVFAPFGNLRLVVIDEEQDISFKQWDMNPRYDARTAALEIARIHDCQIVSGSATPSVVSYHSARNGKSGLLVIPDLEIPNSRSEAVKTTMELVDMRRERWQNRSYGSQRQQQPVFSSISKKLRSEISYALKYGLQAILFINRQGMSNFSVCAACKTVLKCPKCDRALVYENSGEYRCLHCSFRTSITPKCAKCKGIVFKNVGLGTQKVEKEIKEFFPGARVMRADSQELKGKDAHEEAYRKFSDHEADILIGTQMISKGWDLPNVALIGIIDADNMLTLPDFSAEERAFDLLMQVAGRTSRPGAKYPGRVIIQTYHPENRLLKLIAKKDPDSFYEKEFKERKALALPPFGRLIKLVFQDFRKDKADAEAKRIAEVLLGIDGIKVSESQESFVPKVRGRFRSQIIVRFEKEMPDALRKALQWLPAGWIIDVDPISVI
ncbi:MAG: primosomal protein N' [Candidatus Moranbacteria bacterium]|nr:primosomal protein N' [Candidatus Moranbacteria bacterium]